MSDGRPRSGAPRIDEDLHLLTYRTIAGIAECDWDADQEAKALAFVRGLIALGWRGRKTDNERKRIGGQKQPKGS